MLQCCTTARQKLLGMHAISAKCGDVQGDVSPATVPSASSTSPNQAAGSLSSCSCSDKEVKLTHASTGCLLVSRSPRHRTAHRLDVWLGVVLGHSWCCEGRVRWAEGNLWRSHKQQVSSCRTVVAVDIGCDFGVLVFQEVCWHAGANNWPHKPTQWAEGRFQMICYRIGETPGHLQAATASRAELDFAACPFMSPCL